MMIFYRWSFFNAERTVFQSGTQKRGDDGELDTMTGVDPDGSIWQTTKLEEDE